MLLALPAEQPAQHGQIGCADGPIAAVVATEHLRGDVTQDPPDRGRDEHIGNLPVGSLVQGPAVCGHRLLGVAEQLVDLTEPPDVLDHRDDQHRGEQLQRSVGEVRAGVAGGPEPASLRRDRLGADHHDPVGAQFECWLQRCAQPGTAVVVPPRDAGRLVDVNGREQHRDRRRRHQVVVGQRRGHIVVTPDRRNGRWVGVAVALDEDNAARNGRVRRDHRDAVEHAVVHVAVHGRPIEQTVEGSPQRCRVQQPRQAHAGHPEDLAEVAEDGPRELPADE